MNEAVLIHYGILGQKWGKRNGPPYPLGVENRSAAERKFNTGTASFSSQNRTKATNIGEMTDDELRKATQRLNLENNYMNALNANKGKSFLAKTADTAKNVNTILVNANSITRVVTGKSFSDLLLGQNTKAFGDKSKKEDKKPSKEELKEVATEVDKAFKSTKKDLDKAWKSVAGSINPNNKKKDSTVDVVTEIMNAVKPTTSGKSESFYDSKEYKSVMDNLKRKNDELKAEDAWKSVIDILEKNK